MPAPVLHLGATVMCLHAGQATPAAPFARVLVSGQPVVTLTSPYVVAGCALTGTSAPPCVSAQWIVGAVRVVAGGAPLLTFAGQSICMPSGSPLLPMASQPRVMAT
jgi:hypothetical protein